MVGMTVGASALPVAMNLAGTGTGGASTPTTGGGSTAPASRSADLGATLLQLQKSIEALSQALGGNAALGAGGGPGTPAAPAGCGCGMPGCGCGAASDKAAAPDKAGKSGSPEQAGAAGAEPRKSKKAKKAKQGKADEARAPEQRGNPGAGRGRGPRHTEQRDVAQANRPDQAPARAQGPVTGGGASSAPATNRTGPANLSTNTYNGVHYVPGNFIGPLAPGTERLRGLEPGGRVYPPDFIGPIRNEDERAPKP